jgi:Tol biopolymer transport system component
MTTKKLTSLSLIMFLILVLPACSPSTGEMPKAFTPTSKPVEISTTAIPLPPTDEPKPSPTTWPEHSGSGGGVIAFVSDRNLLPVVFLMNADGSDQRQLSANYESHPDWSPDGQALAYASSRETVGAIYMYDLITHTEKKLTQTERSTYAPDWSPDGTQMALIHSPTHPGINYELFIMDANGSGLKALTDSVSYQYYAHPDWSPDGTRIAYAVDIPDDNNIFTMAPDGTDIIQLTKDAGDNFKPAWSPDGTRIAFESDRDGNKEIYIMDADGSNLKRLTDHPDDDRWPSWSPDGTRIAFQSDRDGNWEIYLMNADGSDLIRLTDNDSKDTEPAWRPVN